ncbi:MAG: type I methionyl aminopeptidase [Geminicoccaceae bacterium]
MQDQLKVAGQPTEQVQVPLQGPEAFAGMRRAGRLAAEVLDMVSEHVRPGVTTGELDRLCHAFILDHRAVPAPLNYRGYPKSVCTSINHEVCHGIPGERRLLDGDIMNIDVTVILDGWHGDTSRMFFAGQPALKARRLCQVTFEGLWEGIRAVRPDATLGDVGHAIQSYVEGQRCSVVRDYCGHGIGRVFHDAPSVLHYGRPGEGLVLQPGMIFTIEPMVNLGTWQVKLKKDGWTVITRDRQPSAQFEHSVAVTGDGVEIFTLSPKGLHHPVW